MKPDLHSFYATELRSRMEPLLTHCSNSLELHLEKRTNRYPFWAAGLLCRISGTRRINEVSY